MNLPIETEQQRQDLIGVLLDIESSEELLLNCVKRACGKLRRYSEADKAWLNKWIPILLKKG